MSYKSTVDGIRAAANSALNHSGRFDHGRHVDLSQKFDGAYPFIFLYPITTQPPDDGVLDRNQIVMGFWMQDRPDTSTLEREEIISEMDVLSNVFMSFLKNNDKARVTAIRKEPQYQQYNGTLSGYAVSFQYENFDTC